MKWNMPAHPVLSCPVLPCSALRISLGFFLALPSKRYNIYLDAMRWSPTLHLQSLLPKIISLSLFWQRFFKNVLSKT